MLPVFSAALFILFILLIPLSPILAFSTSSDNNNLQKIATIATTISKEQSNLTPYINPIHGIKVQYPSDWKLVERGDNDYHMLNIIAEFLQPSQSNYYNPNISASHNSLRISVENYSTFADTQDNNNATGNQLQKSELLRKNSKENNTDKKIEILYDINSLIPEPLQLTLLPSMSDDYENNKSIFRELIVSMHK
jgi:PsbP-like protein